MGHLDVRIIVHSRCVHASRHQTPHDLRQHPTRQAARRPGHTAQGHRKRSKRGTAEDFERSTAIQRSPRRVPSAYLSCVEVGSTGTCSETVVFAKGGSLRARDPRVNITCRTRSDWTSARTRAEQVEDSRLMRKRIKRSGTRQHRQLAASRTHRNANTEWLTSLRAKAYTIGLAVWSSM